MISMVCVILLVASGVATAFTAPRHPRYQQMLETLGGFLLIAGFGLLGYLLKFIVSQF